MGSLLELKAPPLALLSVLSVAMVQLRFFVESDLHGFASEGPEGR